MACLTICPNEVVETILVFLDLDDIRSLRRTCLMLAVNCLQDKFKSYFRSKHVDISGSALRELVYMTQPGRLGCSIQHLVLVGVVNNTKLLESILMEEQEEEEEQDSDAEQESIPEQESDPEKENMCTKIQRDLEILTKRRTDYVQLHESGTDVSLLGEAFSNILANSKTGKLFSLSLEVVVYRKDAEQRLPPLTGGNWRFIWQAAADTFHTILRSLSESSLPIEKLNIFNNRQLQRCSLASNELSRINFENKGLATSLASLKSLSISFSRKVIFKSKLDTEQSYDPVDEVDWELSDETKTFEDIQSEAAEEANFIGLAKILKLTSRLEELEMHQYRLESDRPRIDELECEKLFNRIAETDIPKGLKRIELRGLYIREQDLLSFVQKTDIRHFSMINIHLSFGATFTSVFDYCTSEASNMEELYFHKLSEDGMTVYFHELGASQSPPFVGPRNVETLRRVGAEVKQKITHSSMHIFEASSPTLAEYRRQQYIEYGPPDRAGQGQ